MSYDRSPFVFIVRVWFEPREIKDAEENWRCMVENIDTREINYFLSPEKLAEYISRATGFTKPQNESSEPN
ncbi:MAG TPA: hypothetical protein VMC09_11450 [Anaerolineales bacterium]|nr:hypothetical protein [Anaerolineales bacterium]